MFYNGAEILHETTLSMLGVENGAIVQPVLDKCDGDLVVTGFQRQHCEAVERGVRRMPPLITAARLTPLRSRLTARW